MPDNDVAALRADIAALSEHVQDMATALRKSRWMVRLLGALVTLSLLLSYGVVQNARYSAQQATYARQQAACVRDWANAFAARTSALVPAANARTDALDAVMRTVALPEDQRKAKFQAEYVLYLQASDNYKDVANANPPPTAPQYTC